MAQTRIEKAISDAIHRQTVYIIGATFALVSAAVAITALIVHAMK